MKLHEIFNTLKPEFDNELEVCFPSSVMKTDFSLNTGIIISGCLELRDFYRFAFHEKWILKNLGAWMPVGWKNGRNNPEQTAPHISQVNICASEKEVSIIVQETGKQNHYFDSFIQLINHTMSAFINHYKEIMENRTKEFSEKPKYTMIVTGEPDDDPNKRLDYYCDNPWNGYLEDVVHFNTLEQMDRFLKEYEGLFYQLFENKYGRRIGYGMICPDYPATDVQEYEESLSQNPEKSEENTVSGEAESTGQLIVISGFSRAGKDTIAKGLKNLSSNYASSVSVTTRAPRAGEQNEVDYYFVTNDQFLKMKKHNAFLEDDKYCGHYYGTPLLPVQKALQSGKDVILVLETEGAMKVKDLFPQTVTFFVAAPATDILKRMEKDPVSDKEQRISQMQKEISMIPKYDYLIMNEDGKLDENISLIHGIVMGNKQKSVARLDTAERLRKEYESIRIPYVEKEIPVPVPSTVRMEDNTIFHIGDKVIHFKWEMNRECDVNDYIYVITGFPKNTETEEELISYRSVSYPEKEWARPKENF